MTCVYGCISTVPRENGDGTGGSFRYIWQFEIAGLYALQMSLNSSLLYKLTDGYDNPIVYHDTFERGKTTGPDRLIIAPISDQIELICKLLKLMPGPFGFLYILTVPHGMAEEGRYQLEKSLTLDEITDLLTEYQSFFENDSRHSFFVASHSDGAMLVYDKHNIIYAYGDLYLYGAHLAEAGFHNEPFTLPFPHAHHYHTEFDDDEERLTSGHQWIRYPLEEGDDE